MSTLSSQINKIPEAKRKEVLHNIAQSINEQIDVRHLLSALDAEIRDGILAIDMLRRPELSYENIMYLAEDDTKLARDVIEQVEIEVKYEGYIKKSLQQVEKLKKMNEMKIPKDLDYDDVPSLAIEAREKLKKVLPLTIGQASRISGVNPADISILLVFLEQRRGRNDE